MGRIPELLLLKHILRSEMSMKLLVLCTYRDTELSRTRPLAAVLADLHRDIDIERIVLRGLDESGIVDMVTAAAGHQLDEAQLEAARTIARDTEGELHCSVEGDFAQSGGVSGASFGPTGSGRFPATSRHSASPRE